MEKKIGMHRDFYIAIGIFVFSTWVFVYSRGIPGEASYLPSALAVFMACMGAFILRNGLRYSNEARATNTPYKYKIELPEMGIPMIVFGMIVVYLLMFQYLGYYVGSAIFLVALLRYLRAGSWKKILIIAAVYLICCFLLFSFALKIPIYRVGIFGRLFRV